MIPHCPVIETEDQAVAIGMALHKVRHFDSDWALGVFKSDPAFNWLTGPDALNNELAAMWAHYLTGDERERILTEYAMQRLTK